LPAGVLKQRVERFAFSAYPNSLVVTNSSMLHSGFQDARPSSRTDLHQRKCHPRKMKSLRKVFSFGCTLLLTVPTATLEAQNPGQPVAPAAARQQPAHPPQSDAQAKIVKNVNYVVLPVTVKDRGGRLVADLRQDDFRVLEDNVEQKIEVFTAEAFPLSMVVLIDNDLKSKDAPQVEASLEAIVGGMSAEDEAFICRFDEYFYPGKGFSMDPDKLLTELKRERLGSRPSVARPSGTFDPPTINGQSVTGGPATPATTIEIGGKPTKALDDAVYAAAELLKDRGRERRKIIVLVSDGVNAPKQNKNKYDVVLQQLLRYNISVFGVGVGTVFIDRKFDKLDRLARYAHNTGGDVYYASRRGDLEDLYARVTEEARNQYTLAYSPRGTDRGADYHSVEVRVKREGLSILTRDGYYAGALPAAR
jgi:Ca-activated chloride channel homolog